MKEPELKDLKCLNVWRDNTVGYVEEQKIIKALYDLCVSYGFGRIPQLTKQIEDIWRDPEKIEEYQKLRDDHLALMERDRKQMEKYNNGK